MTCPVSFANIANILISNMSIEKPTATTSAQSSGRAQSAAPLTAANLAMQERETVMVSPNHAVREWLNDQPRRRDHDVGSWMQLVEADELAKAIEAAVHVDGHSQEEKDH